MSIAEMILKNPPKDGIRVTRALATVYVIERWQGGQLVDVAQTFDKAVAEKAENFEREMEEVGLA
jgi:hypothetical protein